MSTPLSSFRFVGTTCMWEPPAACRLLSVLQRNISAIVRPESRKTRRINEHDLNVDCVFFVQIYCYGPVCLEGFARRGAWLGIRRIWRSTRLLVVVTGLRMTIHCARAFPFRMVTWGGGSGDPIEGARISLVHSEPGYLN